MRSKFLFGTAVVAAALLLSMTPAFGRGGGGGGGGGGHGGGGGGGGGGHGGGGFGGGGYGGGGYGGGGGRGGGGYSGGSMRSGGSFSGGSSMRSGSLGTSGANHATFMKNNFPGSASSGASGLHQTNRLTSGNMSSLNNRNSFVHSQNINKSNLNHWSHNNGNFNNNFARHNNFFFSPGFGFGWGGGLWGLGYGLGWGWPYYGYGWGGGYGGGYGYGYPLYGYNYYGYGNGYGGGGYGYGNGYANAAPVDNTVAMQPTDVAGTGQFADQGELDFKAGKYQAAARDWQHALIDDSKNGALVMLMGQALFAMGQYDEAAGATQAAMQMLPEDKWGVVITNYAQLYGNIQDYTDQLKALEKARDAKPDSPALRFLLGFHFGYLGYPKHAVRELDKGLTLAPKDFGAYKIREIFAAKWPEAPALPADVVAAAKQAMQDAAKAGQEGGQKGPAGPKPSDGEKAPEPGAKTGAPTGTPS